MIRPLLLLGLVALVSSQPLAPLIHAFLPHSQKYAYVMEQLFDLRSQIRDCRGHFVCDVRGMHNQYKTDVRCIERSEICDTVSNCPSHSDETDCPINCHDQIRCRDDCTCARPCDGISQCPEGEDEITCSPECLCGVGKYLCMDGTTCILGSQLCDGMTQCPNGGDDEAGCPPRCNCGPGLFQCMDGECISRSLICDGTTDCTDGQDEMDCLPGCSCEPGEFFCPNGERCIAGAQVCNQVANECCLEDESNCNEDVGCPPTGRAGG